MSSRTNGQQDQRGVPQEQVRIRDLLAAEAGRLSDRLATTAQRRRLGRSQFQPGARAPIGQQLRQLVQPRSQQQAYGQPQFLGAAEWPQVQATAPWTLALEQRPQWPFGKGGIASIFGSLQQIRTRAPGAAIALVRCLAERQPVSDQDTERGREQIVEELSRILMRFRPTQASLERAAATMQEMQQLSQQDPGNHGITRGRLTAKYVFLEQVYILRAQGLYIGYSDTQIDQEFAELDEELRRSGSTGRLGFVRAVRADILLQQGRTHEADEAMFTAFGLLAKAFPDTELTKLLDSAADTQLVQQVRQEVKVLSGASAGQRQQ